MDPHSKALHELVHDGHYVDILRTDVAKQAIHAFIRSALHENLGAGESGIEAAESTDTLVAVGLAAFNAFLQNTVTGPVLAGIEQVEKVFAASYDPDQPSGQEAALPSLRRCCAKSLETDGVSIYPYVPILELFCLARWILVVHTAEAAADTGKDYYLPWLRLRIHVWHYKLLTQPSLGSGAVFNKTTQWTDVPSLQQSIESSLVEVEKELLGDSHSWKKQDKVLFLVEKASICIMLGWDTKAREALRLATRLNQFVYALSGALGKRTKFQEKSTSQLVVLAKSAMKEGDGASGERAAPKALALNDDTLLESVEYSNHDAGGQRDFSSGLPTALRDLQANEQPQLSPLDQIILLAEATLRDAFSPMDSLTLEEILPFAVRVISDRSTNWQIYTQALLVRSRIEVHRGRTVERSVLQMQALVDQIVVDTANKAGEESAVALNSGHPANGTAVPVIEITNPDAPATRQPTKPTSFLPAAKPTETALAQVRLQYIHALSSPPQWHLESELAFAWASVGSLVSALDLFKRLRLWAEVALCLAVSAAAGDEDGRGAGGEDKARAVLRWQLFRPSDPVRDAGVDGQDVDIADLKASDFTGSERSPPPPNAPRLFCILGDIESEPKHYERAWEISNGRYGRAQKSLGEHYLQIKDPESALAAYKKAVGVNRHNSELWSRLGDIQLRLGHFADAAEAFGRAIGAAGETSGGEDARTWSNLGSALYSLYLETVEEGKEIKEQAEDSRPGDTAADGDALPSAEGASVPKRDAATILSQSLSAYKRGASMARSNWRIWDNVITLASRLRPPAVADITEALRNGIAIRKSEEAIDDEVVRLVITEVLLSQPKPADGVPPPGSAAKAICELLERDVVPLITKRSELWELVARERLWRRDFSGAIDASEKGWRAALSGGGAGSALGPTVSGGDGRNWLVDKGAWGTVVARTDELVSVLENYGPEVEAVGSRWKGKARSAVRSVMGKAKDNWEGSEGWTELERLMESLA